MIPTLFVDSWGWIVLADQSDPSHRVSRAFYHHERESGCRLITTDFVLDEVISFLFNKAHFSLAAKYIKALMESIDQGSVHLERIGPDRFEKAWVLRLKYRDHPRMSFTDFTSFVVLRDLSIRRVMTNDRHFEEVNLGFQRVPGGL